MYCIHYHWIGNETVVDYSPYATLETARAVSDEFNSNHDRIREAYSVVVSHTTSR